MLRDYSGSIAIDNGRNIKKAYKKNAASASREFFSITKLMWQTIGAMLVVTVAIGISSTIWYGWQVQLALDQIGTNKTINNELQHENRLLIVKRDLLLTHNHMEEAAIKLGLRPPTKNQVRYP